MKNIEEQSLNYSEDAKLQDKITERERRKQELAIYREELKTYEKLGALKFQEIVFKVEALKFKLIKKVCPNFIRYSDKYIDWKKKRKIKSITKDSKTREKIQNQYPKLLKYYDKVYNVKARRKRKSQERKEQFRKKVKVISPRLVDFYDKYYRSNDIYAGLSEEEQINKVIELSKLSKMAMRKEFNREKNANYHMDPNQPTEIAKYLEWNKKVHVQGTVVNITTILGLSIAAIAGFAPAIPLIIIELLGMGINFECINIQNYNLCRFKIAEESLIKREQRKMEKNIQEYGEASKAVYKSISKSEDLPSISQVISEITDIEQARQLRKKIAELQAERNVEMNRRNIK